jgi:hypothetical protein
VSSYAHPAYVAPISVEPAQTEVIRQASPAAGVAFTFALEGRWFVRLAAISFRLVTDANAANRVVSVNIEDPLGNVLATTTAALTQAATKTVDYTFLAGVGVVASITDVIALGPLPQVLARPTDVIAVRPSNIQVGDALTRVVTWIERYPSSGIDP